jgi:uncharacterized repeat protein (TIGR02543 family)
MFTAGFADEEDERCPQPCQYDLTIDQIGEGETSPPTGTHEYERCEEVVIRARAATGWHFVEWRGDINSTEAVVEFQICCDMDVTAVFERNEYLLTVTHSGEGSTVPSGESTRLYEDVVRLTARPAPCWEFVGWRGPVASPGSAVTSVTINGDTAVHAVFQKIEYTLEVSHLGEGVTNPSGASIRECGDVVEISAEAAPCWEFVGWRGPVASSGSAVTTVTMTEDIHVQAVFQKIQYNLGVTHEGNGSTTPDGVTTWDCGDVVRIVATPDECWQFDHWEGDVASSGSAVTTVTMDQSKRVRAIFVEMEYNLGVTHEGNGSTTPDGVTTWNCGDIVKLSAEADQCWRFDHWEGDVASPSSAMTTVTMDMSKRVCAIFVCDCPSEMVRLGLSVEGNGTTIPTPGVHEYPVDEVVQLTAIPDDCWEFDHWVGEVASPSSAMTTVTMDESKRVRAVFVPCSSCVELYVYAIGNGSTIPSGSSFHCEGDEVPLTAIPEEGWHFVTWRGGPVTSWLTTESSVIMNETTTVAAVFEPNEPQEDCTLTVTHEGDGYTVPSGAIVVSCGSVEELEAVADPGWSFEYWTGPVADMYDPTTTVAVVTDTEVHAVFLPEGEYWLCIEIEGNGEVDPWGEDGETWHASGAVVDLDVDPDSGWYFYRWEGPDASDISGGEIVMDSNKEIVAVFRRRTSSSSSYGIIIKHTLSISIEGNGTVDPFVGSQKYMPSTVVDLGIDPAAGWTFVGWFGPDGDEVVNEQIKMDDDKTLIARFETTSPPIEPPVEPSEIEIPLVETPLGGGDLPDTSQAIPWMNLVLGFCLVGIGYKNKSKR